MTPQDREKQNRENFLYFVKAFCILAGFIGGAYLIATLTRHLQHDIFLIMGGK